MPSHALRNLSDGQFVSRPESVVGGRTFGCLGAGRKLSQVLVNFYCANWRTTNTVGQLAPYAKQIRGRIAGDMEFDLRVCLRK